MTTDVGDLVAAYKTAVTPLLDHSSVAQLTLHLPGGYDIPGNTLLTSIQTLCLVYHSLI